MQPKNIKQLESQMKVWGQFWARQEQGCGFSSVSMTARICETLETQIFSSSDLHFFSHLSDNIFEPEHIEVITKAVAKLKFEFRKAISLKFIKGKKLDNYHTREGLHQIMGLIDR